jgi:micrococcal nuclease
MEDKLYFYNATVTNVYDGDTIRADIDLGFNMKISNMKIRLSGIDTPEIRGEERPYGLIAKDFVNERIPAGTEIQILTEKDATGKYGRYLATIFYAGGKNLNEELLLSGNAEIYG